MKTYLNALLLSLFFGALAFAQSPDPELATANMVGASNASPVFFEPGAKALSPQEKTELQAMITRTRESEKVVGVKVLAWADREYPERKEKASPKQIELASKRADAIKNYLKNDLKITNVAVYNMAERPSKLSEIFKTDDYEVKSSAEASGAAPAKSKAGYFEEMGRSTTALVLVVTK